MFDQCPPPLVNLSTLGACKVCWHWCAWTLFCFDHIELWQINYCFCLWNLRCKFGHFVTQEEWDQPVSNWLKLKRMLLLMSITVTAVLPVHQSKHPLSECSPRVNSGYRLCRETNNHFGMALLGKSLNLIRLRWAQCYEIYTTRWSPRWLFLVVFVWKVR